MDADETRRPRYRRKRAWAALAGLLLVLYLATFVPTCRTLLRIDPESHPTQWAILVAAHRPTATLLKAFPKRIQRPVFAAVNYGQSADDWKMSCLSSRAGAEIEMWRSESPIVTAVQPVW